jgi:hypothetical protein
MLHLGKINIGNTLIAKSCPSNRFPSQNGLILPVASNVPYLIYVKDKNNL